MALTYFDDFSNKRIENLSEIFADDVSLRDWCNQCHGKDQVLQLNRNIFKNTKSINVTPINIYQEGDVVIGEVRIDIDEGSETLLVTDMIEFNKEGKISAIRAYKGN